MIYDEPQTCAHCGDPINGHPATYWNGGPTRYLHHGDGDYDCYVEYQWERRRRLMDSAPRGGENNSLDESG